jgi:hypothetical protein
VKCCGVKRKIVSEVLMCVRVCVCVCVCVCNNTIFCHRQAKAELHKTGGLKSLQKREGRKRNVSKIN